MNIKHLLMAVILFSAYNINAQNFKGLVLNQENNEPVQEAHIMMPLNSG